jgi:hypothetical protein
MGDTSDPFAMNENLLNPPRNNSQPDNALFNKIKQSFNECRNSTILMPKFYNPVYINIIPFRL